MALRKLDKRAKVSILVGYEGNHIYRVYIPSLKGGYSKVVRTSHARFDEGGLITDPLDRRDDNIFDPKDKNNPLILEASTDILEASTNDFN